MIDLADFLIAVLTDFKDDSLTAQITFLGFLFGGFFAAFALAWKLISRRGRVAAQERDDLRDELATERDLTKALRKEIASLKETEPGAVLARLRADLDAGKEEKAREAAGALLAKTAAAQGLAHGLLSEAALGYGEARLETALAHAWAAHAALPQDDEARARLAGVEARAEAAKATPESPERAEERRIHRLIAENGADAQALFDAGEAEFRKGWYLTAAAILERALALVSAVEGEEGPNALRLRMRIAQAALVGGRIERGARLVAPLPACCESVLGATARETFWAKVLVADAAMRQGRDGEAAKGLRAMLPLQSIALGSEDWGVLTTRFHLAKALIGSGEPAEAIAELTKLMPLKEKVKGADHGDTLATRGVLARAQITLGRAAEAEAALSALLPVSERIRGAEHPETLKARRELSRARLALGRAAEAERELAALLPVWERVAGAEHPSTLINRYLLARARLDLGRVGEAEAELAALLPVLERVEGAERPHTLMTRARLAEAVLAQGRAAEAAGALAALAEPAARVWSATNDEPGFIALLRAEAAAALGDEQAAAGFAAEAESRFAGLDEGHVWRRRLAAFRARGA